MSRNEWENGTVKLPSGYMPKLRAALNAAAEKHIAAITADVNRAWDVLKKVPAAKRVNALYSMNLDVLEEALGLMVTSVHTDKGFVMKVSKPSVKTIHESVITRRAPWSNPDAPKQTVFVLNYEASIALNGNSVEWNVADGNHNVERAHRHDLAKVLFDFLYRVEWTSRSGGTIVGNDEYNQDSRECGGGANYVTYEFSRAKMLANRKQSAVTRSWY